MINRWARLSKQYNLFWIVKVNRYITHSAKLSEKAFEFWRKFRDRFKPLENYIFYYLFQFPPSVKATETFKLRLKSFAKTFGTEKIAVEFRHESWFKSDTISFIKNLGLTFVSIDAPEFPAYVFKTTEDIYLRFHGRLSWYSHVYTEVEMKQILKKVIKCNPTRVFLLFNNDHGMLDGCLLAIRTFRQLCPEAKIVLRKSRSKLNSFFIE